MQAGFEVRVHEIEGRDMQPAPQPGRPRAAPRSHCRYHFRRDQSATASIWPAFKRCEGGWWGLAEAVWRSALGRRFCTWRRAARARASLLRYLRRVLDTVRRMACGFRIAPVGRAGCVAPVGGLGECDNVQRAWRQGSGFGRELYWGEFSPFRRFWPSMRFESSAMPDDHAAASTSARSTKLQHAMEDHGVAEKECR